MRKVILVLIICTVFIMGCEKGALPLNLPNDIKAVYLTTKTGSQLTKRELKKYPQVYVVNNFNDMKTAIGSVDYKIGIWIDKNAVDIDDKKWLLEGSQKNYPLLLIGFYDVVNPIPMRESFFSGSIDWNSKTIEKGFSYWVPLKVSDDSSSIQQYDEGIDGTLSIDEMLRVTDTLIYQ